MKQHHVCKGLCLLPKNLGEFTKAAWHSPESDPKRSGRSIDEGKQGNAAHDLEVASRCRQEDPSPKGELPISVLVTSPHGSLLAILLSSQVLDAFPHFVAWLSFCCIITLIRPSYRNFGTRLSRCVFIQREGKLNLNDLQGTSTNIQADLATTTATQPNFNCRDIRVAPGSVMLSSEWRSGQEFQTRTVR